MIFIEWKDLFVKKILYIYIYIILNIHDVVAISFYIFIPNIEAAVTISCLLLYKLNYHLCS